MLQELHWYWVSKYYIFGSITSKRHIWIIDRLDEWPTSLHMLPNKAAISFLIIYSFRHHCVGLASFGWKYSDFDKMAPVYEFRSIRIDAPSPIEFHYIYSYYILSKYDVSTFTHTKTFWSSDLSHGNDIMLKILLFN